MDAILLVAGTDVHCRGKVRHFFAFRPTLSRQQRITLVRGEAAPETLLFPVEAAEDA
jgi:hypothetical protein